MSIEFSGATVFILAVDEKESLSETVNRIVKSCNARDIRKIVITLKSAQCDSFFYADNIIRQTDELPVEKYVQKSDTLVDCFHELPALTEGSHFVIMSSDLENDPDLIADFIAFAKREPGAIISASKWDKDSSVSDYGFLRKLFSKTVNGFVGLLFGYKGSDFFSQYEIYPVSVYEDMHFELTENFFFELTLKPLSCGVPYFEIPTTYAKRKDGKTHFDLKTNIVVTLKYLKTAIRLKIRNG